MSRADLADDTGSVLLLGIGLLAVCLLALVVVVDASSAFLQRRALVSLADAAALAGAQSIDLDTYYRQGSTIGTRLEPAAVSAAARAQVLRGADSAPTRIESIATDGVTVRVRLTRPLVLPFLGAAITDVVRVESSARLDYRAAN